MVKDLSDMRQHRYGTHYQMRPELFPSCNDPEGYSKSYIKAEHKTQKHITKIEAH
jgi:hypothetical protein